MHGVSHPPFFDLLNTLSCYSWYGKRIHIPCWSEWFNYIHSEVPARNWNRVKGHGIKAAELVLKVVYYFSKHPIYL